MGLFCDDVYTFHGTMKEGHTDRGSHDGDFEKIKYYLDRGKDVIFIIDGFTMTRQVLLTYVDITGNAAGFTVDMDGMKRASIWPGSFVLDRITSADDLPDADDYTF